MRWAIHTGRLAARLWQLPAQADNARVVNILPQNCACILLAAGRSRRFGADDKLLGIWKGLPLITHSAKMLGQVPFSRRVVVGTPRLFNIAFDGFDTIETDDQDAPQSHSICLGVKAVLTSRPDAIVIALGDMPLVLAAHIFALLAEASESSAIVASSNGASSMPPAVFGRDHFAALQSLAGDHGARHLLAMGKQVILPPEQLIDIDTLEDFEQLRGDAG